MKNDSATLSNIQLLRAAAATLVIFVHLNIILSTLGFPIFGEGGVDLFFVISGFIMVYTTLGRNITAGSFLRNRIARIVPIYYLITLVVFAIAVIAPHLLGRTSSNPVDLLKSLLFIPFYKSDGVIEPVLFVGWTLNYEMLFYVLFSVGLLFKSYQTGLLFTIGTLTALTVAGAVIRFPESIFLRFYTSPVMLDFVFGMLIAVQFKRGLALSGAYWKYVMIAATMLSIAALVGLPFAPGIGRLHLLSSGLPAAIAVFAALCLESRGEFSRATTLIGMGDASYSMYLTHPFVTQSFQKLGVYLHASGVLSICLILACAIAVFATAQIVHRAVEVPLTNVARNLFRTRLLKPRVGNPATS